MGVSSLLIHELESCHRITDTLSIILRIMVLRIISASKIVTKFTEILSVREYLEQYYSEENHNNSRSPSVWVQVSEVKVVQLSRSVCHLQDQDLVQTDGGSHWGTGDSIIGLGMLCNSIWLKEHARSSSNKPSECQDLRESLGFCLQVSIYLWLWVYLAQARSRRIIALIKRLSPPEIKPATLGRGASTLPLKRWF